MTERALGRGQLHVTTMQSEPLSNAVPEGDDFLADLNGEQRRAASHGDGPLLIVAGAGTGKTMTLAYRVAYLIASGVEPSRILLLTFTRRAAAEMLRRVEGILRRTKHAPTHKLWGGTFHAIAARLLRIHGHSIGLDPAFTILDPADSEDLLNVLRAELNLTRTDRRFPHKGTCLDIYSGCVNAGQKLKDVLDARFPWCSEHAEDLARLFSAYVDRKEALCVLDFDDLLLFWRGLLEDGAAGDAIRARFDHVLVDEYQDTNLLQADIVRLLRPDQTGVTVVGDDAQAIYSFRAATVRNILDFPKQFPGATVVKLEQNYRSTQTILEATNRVIAQAAERHEKELWSSRVGGERPILVTCFDEDEQSDFVIGQVLEHREGGLELRRQAVLFRAAHHSMALELELTRRNIPYRKYGGLRFAETAHVKDLLAVLRLAENPRDVVAGTRLLLLLPGVGPKTARQMMDVLLAARGDFRKWLDEKPPAACAALWPDFVDLMGALAAASRETMGSHVELTIGFYGPLLEQLYDEPQARLRDLEQLAGLARRFPDRARFLAEITLDPPAYTEDLAGPPHLDDDYLVLSTMHSAKGLEWDAVYVIHAADGNIPSDLATGRVEEIEEELRLFYVALTRAKNWLYVCFPLRYYTHPARVGRDTHGYAQLTRFLPDGVRERFDVREADAGNGDGDHNARRGGCQENLDAVEIGTRVKDLWQC